MKVKRIFLMIASTATTIGLLQSCSDDYLTLAPETDISNQQVTSTVDAAKLGINGLCMAMNFQYTNSTMDHNQNCGESYVNTQFNDGFGPDIMIGVNMMGLGEASFKWEVMGDGMKSFANQVPWLYSYNLINQANLILDGIDTAEGEDDERAFVKAQAMTMRAHAYIKLLQFYAPRWEDSKDGSTLCVVLRKSHGTDAMPLSSMKDALALIYDDLTTAISLYQESGLKRQYKWQPDESIARGLFARAAMIKHDWKTAKEMAAKAREAYKVADNNTYFAGFYKDFPGLMWTQSSLDTDIYYYSWGSHYACNGIYTKNWGIGAMQINIDLYNQLDPNDVRRRMYLTPDKLNEISDEENPAGVKEEDFWNSSLVQPGNLCNMATAFRKDKKKKWGLYNAMAFYCKKYVNEYYTGDLSETTLVDESDGKKFYAYLAVGETGDINISNDVNVIERATISSLPFGSSLKFWSYGPFGNSAYPFMRAAEMCLIEAEASYMDGDAVNAAKCLMEINGERIPGYTAPTGDALLEDIKLCRRIELWGEGFNFSDFKRWNVDIERRAWVRNDPTSGNTPPSYAFKAAKDINLGWRFMIPYAETGFNKLATENDFRK